MIYNSRNYQSLLAAIIPPFKIQVDLQQQKLLELTSLFPHPRRVSDLQQQKLLELTSQMHSMEGITSIYNSRNYQSLLALPITKTGFVQSTIVEIIRAYQPKARQNLAGNIYNSRNYQSLLASLVQECLCRYLQQQKLLELTSHQFPHLLLSPYLQQQKLLELTSHTECRNARIWYLQQQKLLELTSPLCTQPTALVSTIVEIIRAYQPRRSF